MAASKHHYTQIDLETAPAVDSHDAISSRSSTEVATLIEDNEKAWAADRDLHRARESWRSRRLASSLNMGRWVIELLLLCAILGLLVRQETRAPKVDEWELNGDMTGVGPRFDQRLERFQYDLSYAPMNTSEFFTDEVLHKWNHLMPKGMGFQWVNETHKYHDLPKPIDWYDGMTVFTTSVTHQLHCLFAIAQTYSGLSSNHTIPDDHHWHMIHCFAYMRQAIMCSADTALEGKATTFPKDNSGSDGWDATHVCKDWTQVVDYLEGVRAYDDQLIY